MRIYLRAANGATTTLVNSVNDDTEVKKKFYETHPIGMEYECVYDPKDAGRVSFL